MEAPAHHWSCTSQTIRIKINHRLPLQALEAALPESVAGLMELVTNHCQAGAEHGHAILQLLQIAARCVVPPPPSLSSHFSQRMCKDL